MKPRKLQQRKSNSNQLDPIRRIRKREPPAEILGLETNSRRGGIGAKRKWKGAGKGPAFNDERRGRGGKINRIEAEDDERDEDPLKDE